MKKNLLLLAAIALTVIQFMSCKQDDIPQVPVTNIRLDSNAQTGIHLADKDGRALYYFSNDANGLSNCTGGCLTNWAPFLADSSNATFATGLSAADFATIVTGTGAKQTTYKGWPLYYYTPGGTPEAAAQTTGEGIGNIWFVAKPNYSIMVANYQLTGANGINYVSTYATGDGRTNYFTDEKGNTLYSFARDSAYINKFTAADFSNNSIWPMYETENVVVPSTLDKSLFVVATVNGRKQLTYNGWPLYHYGADNLVRGSTKGITIPASLPAGTVWPVVHKEAPPAPRL